MFVPPKRLGDLLVRKGLLTQAQLDGLAAEGALNGDSDAFVKRLTSRGLVDMKDVMRVEGDEIGHPYVNLSELKPDPKVVKTIPRYICEKHHVLMLDKEDGVVSLALSNPFNVFAIDDIRLLTKSEVRPFLCTEEEIAAAIDEIFTQADSADDILGGMVREDLEMKAVQEEEMLSTTQLISIADEAPIVKLTNSVIMQAVRDGASDIHVEPSKTAVRIRFRIDGVMHEEMRFPRKLHAPLVSRYKIMAKLDIAERRTPQDGRIPLRVEGREIELRVASLPTIWGESVCMRILDKQSVMIGLERLGFESKDLQKFRDYIRKPYGIIFSTGPTGSGKTTTLYSVLHELNQVDKNIITIEDPIEYHLTGVSQAQINPRAGLTFASGLRSMLRQDPDIVMVGEIRDRETAETAVHASLTGHLVLSTIHANDTTSTITRMFHMGVEPFLVASSVVCILAQRLIRKICPECREEYKAPPSALERIGIPPDTALFRGRGCDYCHNTGYMGRLGVYELLPMDDAMREMINQRASAPAMRRKALELGMYTLQQDGIRKVIRGVTSVEEVMRVLFDSE